MDTDNSHKIIQTQCLNCETAVHGDFCHQCGQSVRENTDRSIGKLLGDFLDNVFFFDNRYIISLWYLVRFPGRMTVEFLGGKRKKFVSPVTLFLLLNVIYFLVNPLTDYSISLEDQYAQPYSSLVKDWLNQKLRNEDLDFQSYSDIYQDMSDTISKSVMIINVPMIAFFVYLLAFKKRRFYYDSLIFAFHFFSLFMASWIMMDWADELITLLAGHDDSVVAVISFALFSLFLPLLYAMISMKKFMQIKWYWAILTGLGVIVSVTLANLFYRLIILVLTVWMT